jgi:hypothetical protein
MRLVVRHIGRHSDFPHQSPGLNLSTTHAEWLGFLSPDLVVSPLRDHHFPTMEIRQESS